MSNTKRPKGLPPAPIPDEVLQQMAAVSFETVQGWFQNPGADGMTVFERLTEADRKRLEPSGTVTASPEAAERVPDAPAAGERVSAIILDNPPPISDRDIAPELRGAEVEVNGVRYRVVGVSPQGVPLLDKITFAPGIPMRGQAPAVVDGRRVAPNANPDTIDTSHPDYVPHRDPREALAARGGITYRRPGIGEREGMTRDGVTTLNSDERNVEADAEQRAADSGWATSRKARLMGAPDTSGFPSHDYD